MIQRIIPYCKRSQEQFIPFRVSRSLIHNILSNKFRHPERSRGTLHKLPLPCPSHQKHRHPCVYHVGVGRTYAVGNVLFPHHPRSSSLAARAKMLLIFCCALFSTKQGKYRFCFLINFRFNKIKKSSTIIQSELRMLPFGT